MNDRQLFQETFDAVKAPDGLLERVVEQTAPPRRHRSHRGMVGILVAAVLIVALSVSALAVWPQYTVRRVRLFNQELTKLHDLGLFRPELAFNMNDNIASEGQGGSWGTALQDAHADDDPLYLFSIQFDGSANRILSVSFSCWEDVECMIDPDMTLEDFCEIWAEYADYERYEIPGVDLQTRILDAHTLPEWNGTIAGWYLEVLFYKEGSDTAESQYISYCPVFDQETGTWTSENVNCFTFGSGYQKG